MARVVLQLSFFNPFNHARFFYVCTQDYERTLQQITQFVNASVVKSVEGPPPLRSPLGLRTHQHLASLLLVAQHAAVSGLCCASSSNLWRHLCAVSER